MVHMLERAREVHKLNVGLTHRGSVTKCPFCIADEDEQWFKTKNFGFKPPKERPEKSPAPHCANCPLLSLFNVDIQTLMDDCVKMGHFALRFLEERLDD
jgi:hypothetical protein